MNMEPFDNRFDRKAPAQADVNRKLLAACRKAFDVIDRRDVDLHERFEVLRQLAEAIGDAERVQN